MSWRGGKKDKKKQRVKGEHAEGEEISDAVEDDLDEGDAETLGEYSNHESHNVLEKWT